MKLKIFSFLAAAFFLATLTVNAQGYVSQQRTQEQMIRRAYKRGRVTPNEYNKLMKEQNAIKYAISKYRRDGVITPREQDVINGKLARSEDRLARYKNNWER